MATQSDFLSGVNNIRAQIRRLSTRSFNRTELLQIQIFLRNNLLRQAQRAKDSEGEKIVQDLISSVSKVFSTYDAFTSALSSLQKL